MNHKRISKKKTVLILVLLLFIVLPIIAFKNFYKPYKQTAKNNVILNWTPEANAKEYLIQVDDDPDFNSPNVEKRVSAGKTKMVVGVEPKEKPYYWRIKVVKEGSTESRWQSQGEFKESLPQSDFEILMDGEYYRIGEPVKFYLFIRNKGNAAKEFPYEISIESKDPETESAIREKHEALTGKIVVETESYKIEEISMIAKNNLKIGRVIYAVASSGEQKAVETFEIVPVYRTDIKTENLIKGKTGKVQLIVTNTSNSAIGEFKAKLSIESNKLKVKGWFSEKILRNFEPGKTGTIKWEVEAYDTGYAQLVIDILSDGIPDKTGKVVEISYANVLSIDLPNVTIPLNTPSVLKTKVINLSSSPVEAVLEFQHHYGEGSIYPIIVKETKKIVKVGPASEKCVFNKSGECVAEVEWEIKGTEYGTFFYKIKAEGFEVKNEGVIKIAEEGHKIDLIIDGDDKYSEKITTEKGENKAIEFKIEVKNLSNLSDSVFIYIFPDGTGWYIKLYDEEELVKVANYTINIPPNSSHRVKITAAPYEGGTNFTNPLEIEIQAVSQKNSDANDTVIAKAIFKEQ